MMNDLSPALRADLDYALARWGVRVEEVPRDREGKTITDRLAMLLADGESYCGSEYTRRDLRRDDACVWELFPENRDTLRAQTEMIEEVGQLLRQDEAFRAPPHAPLIRRSELPRAEHVAALERLLSALDGVSALPAIDERSWADTSLFEEAAEIVPGLRAAEAAAAERAALIAELASGDVPPLAAVYVRKALDSEVDGLRNADVTLAGYQVAAARLRDAAGAALDDLRPHFAVAERIRQLRDELNSIDDAVHWPGDWRTAPRRNTVGSHAPSHA